MKLSAIALSISIAAASQAQAQNPEYLCRSDFAKFKETATNMLPLNLRPSMAAIRLEIGAISDTPDFSMTNINVKDSFPLRAYTQVYEHFSRDGEAKVATNTIKVSCNEDSETNSAVIAHEFGHFLAEKLGIENSEDQANVFGAEVFFQSGKESSEYLSIIDKICNKGSEYFCRRAIFWRKGLIGG